MDNSFVRRMAKGGDGGKKVGKKIVDGRFVSSGFIVMACARGVCHLPFFVLFSMPLARERDSGRKRNTTLDFFTSHRTFSISSFFLSSYALS